MPTIHLIAPQLPTRTALRATTVPEARATAAAVLGVVAIFLYAVSFVLPATDGIDGYGAFVFALVFMVLGYPLWVANPFFWAGLVKLYQGHYQSAARAGLTALLLALMAVFMHGKELRSGYFLWVGSMAVLTVAGMCGAREPSRPRAWACLHGALRQGEASRIAARFRR